MWRLSTFLSLDYYLFVLVLVLFYNGRLLVGLFLYDISSIESISSLLKTNSILKKKKII